jgi:hypothetical protein
MSAQFLYPFYVCVFKRVLVVSSDTFYMYVLLVSKYYLQCLTPIVILAIFQIILNFFCRFQWKIKSRNTETIYSECEQARRPNEEVEDEYGNQVMAASILSLTNSTNSNDVNYRPFFIE